MDESVLNLQLCPFLYSLGESRKPLGYASPWRWEEPCRKTWAQEVMRVVCPWHLREHSADGQIQRLCFHTWKRTGCADFISNVAAKSPHSSHEVILCSPVLLFSPRLVVTSPWEASLCGLCVVGGRGGECLSLLLPVMELTYSVWRMLADLWTVEGPAGVGVRGQGWSWAAQPRTYQAGCRWGWGGPAAIFSAPLPFSIGDSTHPDLVSR